MKRYNKFVKYISKLCLVCIMIMLYSCTEDDKVVSNYIKLSLNSYTFGAEPERLEIKVDANPEWKVEVESDWLKIINESDNSITLEAQSNLNGEEREVDLIFSSADVVETVKITQLTEYINPKYRMVDTGLQSVVISHSGKYLAAVRQRLESEIYYYAPVNIETTTGQILVCGPEQTNSFQLVGVTDDGTRLFFSGDNECGYFKDNEKFLYTAPAGYRNPKISAISQDASIVIGYVSKEGEFGKSYPARWTNGSAELLPLPVKDLLDDKDNTYGAIPRGCSADGTVITGELLDDRTGIFWKNGNVEYVSKKDVKKGLMDVITMWGDTIKNVEAIEKARIGAGERDNISPNGKYIAVDFRRIKEINGVRKLMSIPAFFNTESQETIFIENLPEGITIEGTGLTVSDEGMGFFSSKKTLQEMPRLETLDAGYAYDLASGETFTTAEYMLNKRSLVIGNRSSMVRKVCIGDEVIFGENFILTAFSYTSFPWYITPPIN